MIDAGAQMWYNDCVRVREWRGFVLSARSTFEYPLLAKSQRLSGKPRTMCPDEQWKSDVGFLLCKE